MTLNCWVRCDTTSSNSVDRLNIIGLKKMYTVQRSYTWLDLHWEIRANMADAFKSDFFPHEGFIRSGWFISIISPKEWIRNNPVFFWIDPETGSKCNLRMSRGMSDLLDTYPHSLYKCSLKKQYIWTLLLCCGSNWPVSKFENLGKILLSALSV